MKVRGRPVAGSRFRRISRRSLRALGAGVGSLLIATGASAAVAAPATTHVQCRAHATASTAAAPRASSKEELVDLAPLTPNCFDRRGEAKFKAEFAAFRSNETLWGGRAALALKNITDAVEHPPHGGRCSDTYNAAYSRAKARAVLSDLLPAARKYLDSARRRKGQMASSFAGTNAQVDAGIIRVARELGQTLADAARVNTGIEAAATDLSALNCDVAQSSAESWWKSLLNIFTRLLAGEHQIDTLLQDFDKAPCKDFATEGAPMSPSQVSHAAGGSGSQSATAGKLQVIAPRRLRGAPGGVLTVSLRAHASGFLRLEMTHGKTTITGFSALMKRGAASVRVALPKGATRGLAKLWIVFSSSNQTKFTTLTVRVV